jgi:hypothetical protein
MRYQVGDIVIICSKPKDSDHIPWESGMDLHCGNSGKIISTATSSSYPIYEVESKASSGQEESWWYQETWLARSTDYYWTGSKSAEAFRKSGLEELRRQEESLKHKRDLILKKVFQK